MLIFQCIKYAIIGFIECFGVTLNTKFIQRNKNVLAFITSYLNVLIWVYIIETVGKLDNRIIIHVYALAFAFATTRAIKFDNKLEKLAKMKGKKLSKKLRMLFLGNKKK